MLEMSFGVGTLLLEEQYAGIKSGGQAHWGRVKRAGK
jgi:hypothetical protein